MNQLQKLLPGEDLFGLLGRSLVMGTYKTFRSMRLELGLSHYKHIPGLLTSPDFSKIAECIGKDVRTLHAEHTCRNMLKSSVTGGQVADDKSVSLHKGGDYISQPWRWCPECTAEDIEQFGITYYRRDHQVPGVKTCSKHHTTLVSADCHQCGFKANSLKKMLIPPVDGKCPDCGAEFKPDISLFTPKMHIIQNICLDMACDRLHIDQTRLAKRVQRYLGVTQEDIDLDIVRSQIRRFYRDVINFYDIEELQEYFVTGSERKSGVYCPALQAGHVYDVASSGKPLHPVAMALVWHFLDAKDVSRIAA